MLIYTLFDWAFTIASVFLLIYLPIQYEAAYLLIGIASYLFYPFVLELVYNVLSWITYSEQHPRIQKLPTIPIVYSSDYNITACGIEKAHPFDSCKYGRIYEQIQHKVPNPHHPTPLARQLLCDLGLSRIYLLKMCYSAYISTLVELPICFLPGAFIRQCLLDPMIMATAGTIDAACLALKFGWAINLSGGYHHAHLNGGGGFCVYPDITLAIKYLRRHLGINKAMIVDLDAHQGNGYERDFLHDSDICIVDFYNHFIYPNDQDAKAAIQCDVSINSFCDDDEFCQLVKSRVSQHIDQFKPQFLLYNAGTDCLLGDPLGNLSITPDGIIRRDQIMIEICKLKRVPILMVLSGGYQQSNANIIATSVLQILQGSE